MSAENKFRSLMLELGVRKNNEHIGSGMGGDPEVFLTLLALTTVFVSDNNAALFKIEGDTLNINSDKFIRSNLREIRKALTEVITSDIKGQYVPPKLLTFLEGKGDPVEFSALVLSPRQEQLLEGFILARRIRALVESEIPELNSVKTLEQCSSELQLSYKQVSQLPDWVVLMSFRTQIGIEFLVRYNLDELFADLLNRINAGVEVPTT